MTQFRKALFFHGNDRVGELPYSEAAGNDAYWPHRGAAIVIKGKEYIIEGTREVIRKNSDEVCINVRPVEQKEGS